MINFFRQIRKKLADNNQFLKYSRYAIGEIVLVVVGILIALSINNWNQERINENNVQGMLKLVHRELLGDIRALESEIRNRNQKYQLMSRSLRIIEEETSLNDYNRQVLDSAFTLYTRMEPRFNNTRTYETFLSTESEYIDDEIYSKLNDYLDDFFEVNARIERFSLANDRVEFDILMSTSIKRKNSGEFVYSFETIQQEKNLYEIMRKSKQHFQAIVSFYSKVLERAKDLESRMRQ
jgi:hypothetical protein